MKNPLGNMHMAVSKALKSSHLAIRSPSFDLRVLKNYHESPVREPWGHQATAGGSFHGSPLIGGSLSFNTVKSSHLAIRSPSSDLGGPNKLPWRPFKGTMGAQAEAGGFFHGRPLIVL